MLRGNQGAYFPLSPFERSLDNTGALSLRSPRLPRVGSTRGLHDEWPVRRRLRPSPTRTRPRGKRLRNEQNRRVTKCPAGKRGLLHLVSGPSLRCERRRSSGLLGFFGVGVIPEGGPKPSTELLLHQEADSPTSLLSLLVSCSCHSRNLSSMDTHPQNRCLVSNGPQSAIAPKKAASRRRIRERSLADLDLAGTDGNCERPARKRTVNKIDRFEPSFRRSHRYEKRLKLVPRPTFVASPKITELVVSPFEAEPSRLPFQRVPFDDGYFPYDMGKFSVDKPDEDIVNGFLDFDCKPNRMALPAILELIGPGPYKINRPSSPQ